MNYVATPTSIRLSDVLGKKTSLSPNNYRPCCSLRRHTSKTIKRFTIICPIER